MMRPMSLLITVAISLELAACSASGGVPVSPSPLASATSQPSVSLTTSTPSSAPSATATVQLSPSPSPSASVAPASPSAPAPEPTTDLARFDCTLPETLPATVDRAQITDARVGSHGTGASGYDRIVFEFGGSGIPEVSLRVGKPPFTRDPSGLPLPVRGSSFLVLVLHGATAITPDGTMTYSGPTDFTPRYPTLTEFTEAGDFEAVSEWVAGLTGPACHRLSVLKNPTRLVIDLQHPH